MNAAGQSLGRGQGGGALHSPDAGLHRQLVPRLVIILQLPHELVHLEKTKSGTRTGLRAGQQQRRESQRCSSTRGISAAAAAAIETPHPHGASLDNVEGLRGVAHAPQHVAERKQPARQEAPHEDVGDVRGLVWRHQRDLQVPGSEGRPWHWHPACRAPRGSPPIARARHPFPEIASQARHWHAPRISVSEQHCTLSR